MIAFLDKLRFFTDWAPLISSGQQFASEQDGHKRTLIVTQAAAFLASKTETKFDDGLVSRVDAVLRTPQGEDLLRYVLENASKIVPEAKP